MAAPAAHECPAADWVCGEALTLGGWVGGCAGGVDQKEMCTLAISSTSRFLGSSGFEIQTVIQMLEFCFMRLPQSDGLDSCA